MGLIMKTDNNSSLSIAITEINRMLNDLKNAHSFDEFSMINHFLKGFAFGQFKQGILTENEYENLCTLIDDKNLKNSSLNFEVKRNTDHSFKKHSLIQRIFLNIRNTFGNQMRSFYNKS